MNKTELVNTITEHLATEAAKPVAKSDVARVLNAALEAITLAVAAGDEVQVQGFGTWKRSLVKGGTGRNPSTGEPIKFGDTWTVRFSAGAGFKGAVKAGPALAEVAA